MLNHKNNLDIINQLEESIDLSKITYCGINVWPIVKLAIYQERHDSCQIPKKSFGTLFFLIKKILVKLVNVNTTLNRKDIIFLSRYENYSVRKEGRYFDKHIDPHIENIDDRISHIKLELFSSFSRILNKAINPYYLLGINSSSDSMAKVSSIDIQLLSELNKVRSNYFHLTQQRLSVDWVIEYVHTFKQYSDYFVSLLEQIKPRLAFVTCYYSPMNMGFVNACKRLGVLVVDIQHGQQGMYHPMYNNWTVKTEKWNDLVPDKLWVWDKSESDISLMNSNKYQYIERIDGGNQFVSTYLSNRIKFDKKSCNEYLEEKNNKYSKTILVVCSNVQNIYDLVHDNVIALMKENNGWFWVVRLHPNSPPSQSSILSDYLYKSGAINFSIMKHNQCNFIAAIINVDVLISNNSSALIEGLEIKLCRIIVHEYGKILYQNYIDAGLLYYAGTLNDIRTSIASYKNPDNNEYNHLISTNKAKYKAAMSVLMDNYRS